MRLIRWMWLEALLAYYQRAIASLSTRDPLNPDLAWLPIRVVELSDEIATLKACR